MVVISDIHLGKIQDTIEKGGIPSLPSRVYDAMMRVKEAIEYAKETDSELVIAGDIFDSAYPSPYLIDIFLDLMEEADSRLRKTWIIPGNHDCGIKYHSLVYISGLLDSVELIPLPMIRTVSISGKKIRTAFLPHLPKDAMEERVKKYGSYLNAAMKDLGDGENIGIVVSHAHLYGAKNASDVELEAGEAIHFKGSDFFKYKVGVFGHIHAHQTLGKNHYCGPVVTNSFDEAELIKGMLRVDKSLEVAFIPFKTPETEYRKVTVNLVDKDAIDLSAKKLEKIGKGKLLKIVVYARSLMQVHENEIKAAFSKVGGHVVRFETVLCDDAGSIDETEIDSVVEDINYKPVLEEWLKSKKLPSKDLQMSLSLGNSIIEEVLSAARAED